MIDSAGLNRSQKKTDDELAKVRGDCLGLSARGRARSKEGVNVGLAEDGSVCVKRDGREGIRQFPRERAAEGCCQAGWGQRLRAQAGPSTTAQSRQADQ